MELDFILKTTYFSLSQLRVARIFSYQLMHILCCGKIPDLYSASHSVKKIVDLIYSSKLRILLSQFPPLE